MGRDVAAAAAGLQRQAHAWTPVRSFAVDGGAGTHLLERLPRRDPALSYVLSPWQADLLLIVGPLTTRIVPAVREVVQALPDSARILVVRVPNDGTEETDLSDTLLSDARQVPATTPGAIVAAVHEVAPRPPVAVTESVPLPEAPSIPLPQASELEMATELEVLSLGPLQPFTAGPLRLWLICDGGQVYDCRIEAGYVARGLAARMERANWQEAARFATALDPLAPLAGRLAYVWAVEHLQQRTVPATVEHLREAALALERAQNALWWTTRFFRLMALSPQASAAGALAVDLDQVVERLWPTSPVEMLAPGLAPQPQVDAEMPQRVEHLRKLAQRVERLARRVASDRLLAVRMRGSGWLAPSELVAAGVTGPALYASERGGGDVIARLISHLDLAHADLERAAQVFADLPTLDWPERVQPDWTVSTEGEVTGVADGPRGRLAVRLRAGSGMGPAAVSWERPSAALLTLAPQLLAGQMLGDVGLLVASLDLSMAEADG